MRKAIIAIALVTCLAACNSQQSESEKVTPTDSVVASQEPDILQKQVSMDNMTLSKSDTISLNLKMDSSGHHDTIRVSIMDEGQIAGLLSSDDKKANIRFTQIGLPDSTFDGPFGRELHYKVSQKGKYLVIIGQNMMAGDPWKGKYDLKLWLE